MFRKKSKQYRNSRYKEQPPPLGLRVQGRTLPGLQSESCCRAWSTGWQRECYDVDWQNLLGGHPLGRQAKLVGREMSHHRHYYRTTPGNYLGGLLATVCYRSQALEKLPAQDQVAEKPRAL